MARAATFFAEGERASESEVARQAREVKASALVAALMDCFPEPALILNRWRQIVHANRQFADLLGHEMPLGLRPGEALGCEHAGEGPAGCGTSEACRYCGAVLAIVTSMTGGGAATRECRLTRHALAEPAALDVRVRATPLRLGTSDYIVLALRDITDEKRRAVLERLFFHDAINTAGGIRGLAEYMTECDDAELRELPPELVGLSDHLLEEIEAQRDLAAAERGDLAVRKTDIDVAAFLGDVGGAYARLDVAHGRNLRVEAPERPTTIRTDPLLLRRVLGNLVKNALEATPAGGIVTLGFRDEAGPVFSAHNDRVMPAVVRHQVFQRSFSTKQGQGRGIGTWSVKLLTERYLGGAVSFVSEPGRGTIFFVRLP